LGFIAKAAREERYEKISRGEWKIRFVRRDDQGDVESLVVAPEPVPAAREVQEALVARGVTATTAAELAARHPAEHVRERIEMFDWLAAKKDKRVSKNPGGYLAESVRKGYAPPKGFESKADQERKRAEELDRKRRAEEAKRRAEAEQEAREAAEQARIKSYLDSLTPDEREALEAEALSKANSFFLGQYRRAKGNPESEARYFKLIVETHVSGILETQPEPGSRP
jgi:hypothetical protein